ncbi:ARID DNA-binding domain-containing protein [Tanacetum coccineum]|uniref:ARID DNA-binding domain-containing protein n=1 Tax=Tanacetum coccineum TaxID=301880 RepID=A0ABQ4Y7H8_9ASTR
MLQNKIEQINLFNSTLSSNKFRDYTCFYCTQKGHVAKSCTTKLSDERLYAQAGSITFRHGDEATRARIRKNKETVKCFKCQGTRHFANACPRDDTKTMQKQEKKTTAVIPSLPEPKVSVKYPEFIHIRTRGIIDGTDKGSWDDFWQQGFEISSNEDRCTLAYMFKDKRGKNINLDRMREQHNNYLEDYFDALDRSANIERKVEQPYEKENDDVEIGNFRECVAFLDLIRKGKALSNEWEVHRDKFNRVLTWFFNHFLMRPLPGSLPPIIKGVTIHLFDLYELIECMGGYISVQFEGDFEGLAEILGLERSDGLDIRRCYLDYLEPLVSNYKAARSSNPTGGYEDEGIRRFEDYHGDGNKDGSTAVKEKGRVEHFGITLEKEEEGKYDATAQQDEEDVARIKCYLCQRMGHFDTECPNEDQRPTNGATTSRQQEEEAKI